MAETLPLREARAVPTWFAAPLVVPPARVLPEPGRPRIYIVPLASRIDGWIARASLAAAGLPAPGWIPGGSTREARVREDFLAGVPLLVPLTAPRRGPDRLARALSWAQRAGVEVDLVPVETLWGPDKRAPSLRSVLIGGANDPPAWRRLLAARLSGVRVAVGAPGTLSRLAAEVANADDALALSAHVRRQAVKALSIAERHVFGDWYKVPRLVVEQILSEPDFQDRVAAAGAAIGRRREEALRSAERGLRELATRHNLAYVELLRRFVRWTYTKVYEPEISVDAGQLEQLRALSRRAPLVFVPSHKSNFDHLILYYTLLQAGFPPPHTAAGINMSFFPMSRILPGTGAYFIRRTFQDDPVYRECLRGFIAYLVERRFHQEFFVEGGRSRTGKLLPPRYGMLNYVVDGARRCHADDVLFIPTAIAYDEVAEVGEYVREQLGEDKKVESLAFLVRLIWSLRRRTLGRVYVRFAEPISLARWLDRAGEDRLVVEKLAFQIAQAINEKTPLTAVAAVCSVFLGAGRRGLTTAELEHETERLIDYSGERGIPVAPELEQGAKITVTTATRALRRSGVVSAYEEGLETVYFVPDEQRHIASFYRNTTAHFFLAHAIASLAREAARKSGNASGWALRLRELLKFEFFFPERDAFVREVERESQALERCEQAGAPPMGAAGPRLVLDYLEGYWVAMRALDTLPPNSPPVPRTALQRRCLAIGRQLLLQGHVAAPELLTSVNFRNALQLAENQGAVRSGSDGYSVADAAALHALAADLDALARAARR